MNILLIFFALPIATIIVSIALQKILKCPALVAAIIFAIFLVVTFIINSLTFLVATIAYTIISFITAIVFCFICRILECNRNGNGNGELLTISSNGCNGTSNDLLTISSSEFNINNNGNCSCNNSDYNFTCTNNNGVTARVNVIPNNRRTTCSCGNFRRR